MGSIGKKSRNKAWLLQKEPATTSEYLWQKKKALKIQDKTLTLQTAGPAVLELDSFCNSLLLGSRF